MRNLWYVACCEMLYMEMCSYVEACYTEEDNKINDAWQHAFDVHHCPDCLGKCANCERI